MTARASSTCLTLRMRPALIGLVALALGALPVLAADFPEPPPYGQPEGYGERRPPPPPRFEEPGPVQRHVGRPPEPCRTVIRRRVTPDGEEVVRRITICEESRVRPEPFRFEPDPRGDIGGPRGPAPPREVPDGRYGEERFRGERLGDRRFDERSPADEASPEERDDGQRY